MRALKKIKKQLTKVLRCDNIYFVPRETWYKQRTF